MEYMLLENLITMFLRRWLMHKISQLIKSKWYNQPGVTRELFLDKLVVLHKSDHYLAVEKLPDLVINTNPPDTRLSLYEQIAHKYPHLVQPKLVHGFYVAHRLDFSTSGVVLVPLTKKSAAEATKQFSTRETKKFYTALLYGHVDSDFTDIFVGIGDVVRGEWAGVKMAAEDDPDCSEKSRPSRTRMMVLEKGHYRNKPASKVLLSPITGRRHQLRLHCDYIGHRIVGDFTYSNRSDVTPPRMFLHAHRLIFRSKFENLDIVSEDPFTSEKFPEWKPTETICDINNSFTKMYCDEKNWKIVEARK